MAKKGGAPTKSEVLTQISKDTGLSRKQVGGVFDSLGGVIKKSLQERRSVHDPGTVEAEGRQEARHEGTRRGEPVHRREDDVQGQAREQEGSRAAVEDPQVDGQFIRRLSARAARYALQLRFSHIDPENATRSSGSLLFLSARVRMKSDGLRADRAAGRERNGPLPAEHGSGAAVRLGRARNVSPPNRARNCGSMTSSASPCTISHGHDGAAFPHIEERDTRGDQHQAFGVRTRGRAHRNRSAE